MAKRKDYLVRSLVVSLTLHAALLSLQFGAPGMSLPWPSLAWNERKASVPTIQAVLRGQTPIAIPQQKTANMAEAPLPHVPAKAVVTEVNKPPPPPAPLPASVPDQPRTMTASIAAAKASTPPPATPDEVAKPVVKAKEKRSQTAGSAVLSTDKEAQWSIPAAKTAQESEDESRDDLSVMETAREAEAIEKKMNDELAEQRRLAKAAEENRERQRAEVLARTAALKAAEEARERKRLDTLALARSAEEKRAEEQAAMISAQEAALEKNRAEALQRTMEAKRKEAQTALTKAEEAAQQRAEALAMAAALKAAEEAQERKRIEALAAARLTEEKKAEEQAAMIREKEAALEKKRLEALQRAAEEKRKEEQAALAKTKEEALARAAQAAQAEARAREQAESGVNQANSRRSPAQLTTASDRGAGNSASAMTGKQGAGKPGGSGQKGGDLASRALDMARSGLSGLPVKVPFDTDRSRRGSLLGRNPSDIQLTFYGESWIQKVERIANLNYPQLSKNRSYGSLVITVSINSDGTLAAVRVVKTSGSAELDAAARHIVEMSAPFSAFPPDLKRNYDVVDITRTLSFPEKPPVIFGL